VTTVLSRRPPAPRRPAPASRSTPFRVTHPALSADPALLARVAAAVAATDAATPTVAGPGREQLPGQLLALADTIAREPALTTALVRHDAAGRWWLRLLATDALDVWLLGWTAGQSTRLHDHGGAVGAFRVVGGTLLEDTPLPDRRGLLTTAHGAGAGVGFGGSYVHRVRHRSGSPAATSVHAYSPPDLPLRTRTAAELRARLAG
jgi:hypothetical protein